MATPSASMLSDPPLGSPVSIERHYAPSEVSQIWQLDVATVPRLFRDEPGVLVLQSSIKKGIREYKTIRIPKSVLERVHQRLQR